MEKRNSIINKQEGHIVHLKNEMEETEKYLDEIVDGKEEVRTRLKFSLVTERNEIR